MGASPDSATIDFSRSRRLEEAFGLIVVVTAVVLGGRAYVTGPAPPSASPEAADRPVRVPQDQVLPPTPDRPALRRGGAGAWAEMAEAFEVPLFYLALPLLGGLVLLRVQDRVFDFRWWCAPAQAPPDWRLWDCAKVLAFFSVCRTGAAHLPALDGSVQTNALASVVLSLLTALYALVILEARGAVGQLGLERRGFLGRLRTSLTAYLAFVPVFTAASIFNLVVVVLVLKALGRPILPEQQETIQLLVHADLDPAVRAALWAYAAVGAAITEELLIRGLLYGALRRHLGWQASALTTALLFGLLHFDPLRFLPLALLGFFLAVLRERTRGLTVPMCVHALHNSLVLLMLAALGA